MRSLSCLGVWRERREGCMSVVALKPPVSGSMHDEKASGSEGRSRMRRRRRSAAVQRLRSATAALESNISISWHESLPRFSLTT